MLEEPVAAETTPQEIEECPCEIELKPMAEWVKGPDPDECRPCTLAPVVQWYWSELNEQGQAALAKRLEEKVEGLDEDKPEQVIEVCKELDKIKAEVPSPLRKRLEEFDCAVESFKLEEGETVEEEAAEQSAPSPEISLVSDSPESLPPQPHSSDTE
jgi:hypothetical protein